MVDSAWPERIVEPIQVRQVRKALEEYRPFIDLADKATRPANEQEDAFLSRALSALALRHVSGMTVEQACGAVTDGYDDWGLDAIGVLPGGADVWLVQAKWNKDGRARFGVDDARAVGQGLTMLTSRDFDKFNARVQALQNAVVSAIEDPDVRIHIVIAVMGEGKLSGPVQTTLKQLRDKYGHSLLDYQVVKASTFHETVRAASSSKPIDLTVKMLSRLVGPTAHPSCYGVVSSGEVAAWHEDHGVRLFDMNLRFALPKTLVNQAIVETLTTRPADLWDLHNGIKIVCESMTATPYDLNAPNGPTTLILKGASIVNGAQSVTSIAEAVRQSDDAKKAHVGVLITTVGSRPPGFAKEVAVAANRQNHVTDRDFAAQDPRQARLRDELMLDLQKSYSIKRGEPAPPNESGCTVDEALYALACAHDDTVHACRVLRNADDLWSREPGSTYPAVFTDDPPSGVRLWRTVEAWRSVRATLQAERVSRVGRMDDLADTGQYLIAHIVLRYLGDDLIDDATYDWDDEVLSRVPGLTRDVLARLLVELNSVHGSDSYIKGVVESPGLSKSLADRVLQALASNEAAPDVPVEYLRLRKPRRGRRPNAVTLIVEHDAIASETLLTFAAFTGPETKALENWLADDPRRGRATWVASRSKPLLWEADGRRYAPSTLVDLMWREAEWKERPVSNQGPRRWLLPSGESLAELARRLFDDATARWTVAHASYLLEKLPDLTRDVLRAVVAGDGWCEAAQLRNDAGGTLRGSTGPITTLIAQAVDDGDLPDGLPAPIEPSYDPSISGYHRVLGFTMSQEVLPAFREAFRQQER